MAEELEPSAPPVADPPPDPPAAPPDPDEANAIEVQGGKMVPLAALKASREESRSAKEAASAVPQLQNELATLRGQVQAFQEVQRTLAQSRTEAFATPAPVDDPNLLRIAKALDYYDTSGKPDPNRAKEMAAIIREEAQKMAQTMVAPLHDQTARAASEANFQRALTVRSPQGVGPKPETLQWMWQNLPASYTADPRVAQALPALAMGLETLQGNGSKLPAQPLPPAHPPLVTEPIGGTPAARSRPLSDFERAVITDRGMDEKKYESLTKNFRADRVSSLED